MFYYYLQISDVMGSTSTCYYYYDIDKESLKEAICQEEIRVKPRFTSDDKILIINVTSKLSRDYIIPFSNKAYTCNTG